jgi:Protein of unknown function (DUF3093)
MEPSVEIFVPSRLYSRAGWLTSALAAALLTFGMSSLALLIPGAICAVSALVLLWLSSRPLIRVGETQFNIGERSIAWREVKEMNRVRLLSPLILRITLTNSRKKLLIYPGELGRVEQLVHLLRKNSHLATFDGVAYRDYWTWSSMTGIHGQNQPGQTASKPLLEQPVRMLTSEEEDEIERMFQKLKAVGSLDSRLDPINSDED